MKDPSNKLHEISSQLKKILDLTYPLCKSDNLQIRKTCHSINNKNFELLKELQKLIDSNK